MIAWRLLSVLQTCFEFNMECQWHYWGALSRSAALAEEYEKMATLRREYSRWKAGPQKTEYTNCIKLHQIAESQEKIHLNSCTMIQNDESRGLVGDGLGFVAISLSCPGSLDRNALLVAAKEASLGRALHVPGFELDPALLEPLRLGWWRIFCTNPKKTTQEMK